MNTAFQQLAKPGASWRDGSDFWKELCLMCRDEDVRDEFGLKRITDQLERDYNRRTGESRMPSKYRSAKSVIAKALRYKVAYLMHNGVPRGKTAVENACAARE